MKIQLKVQISGTRNGDDWPAPGSIVDLPDDESIALLASGSAIPVEPDVETADAPAADVETADAKATKVKS